MSINLAEEEAAATEEATATEEPATEDANSAE